VAPGSESTRTPTSFAIRHRHGPHSILIDDSRRANLSRGPRGDERSDRLSFGEFLLEGLPEEPAIAVDNDKIEGMLAIAGAFEGLARTLGPMATPSITTSLEGCADLLPDGPSCPSSRGPSSAATECALPITTTMNRSRIQ